MMKKFLTVAAGLIAAVPLLLVTCPAMAHGSGYAKYGASDRPARDWDRDGDGGRDQYDRRHGRPFAAWVSMAPPPGAVVRGIVRLEVHGRGMMNVELLPASGYIPRLGVFHVSPDGRFAWLDFDTRALPDGQLDVRISAFNVPPKYPGASEIVAMPPRPWHVR